MTDSHNTIGVAVFSHGSDRFTGYNDSEKYKHTCIANKTRTEGIKSDERRL